MTERAMATIQLVGDVSPLENSDNLDVVSIMGWKVVARRGEFTRDDHVVFFSIDSFLPLDDSRFTFLAPRGARKNPEGVEGHVLKTAKLRGQYSQGLALPRADFPEVEFADVGEDVTALIPGVEKWDPPIPAELAGSAKGAFPSFIRKTDEERVQNMPYVFDSYEDLDGGWIATEKIDGSSMTVYIKNGEVGVASRNWDLEETSHNSMWKLAHELGIIDWLKLNYPGEHTAVFQGEIFGPGIQGNPLDQKEVQFRIFNMFADGHEIHRSWWPDQDLEDDFRARSVPLHLELPYPRSIEEALAQVENLPSKINPQRPAEGVVWRNTRATDFPNGARASWKAISQRYLLKHDR